MALTIDHEEQLHKRLKDREYAAGYLSACAIEGKEALLVGLRHVAKAQGGFQKLADETKFHRENVSRMLSENGNPTLENVLLVLDKLGLDIQFSMKHAS